MRRYKRQRPLKALTGASRAPQRRLASGVRMLGGGQARVVMTMSSRTGRRCPGTCPPACNFVSRVGRPHVGTGEWGDDDVRRSPTGTNRCMWGRRGGCGSSPRQPGGKRAGQAGFARPALVARQANQRERVVSRLSFIADFLFLQRG